jgi:uncharacterized repeat protein (TIGR01451 family)
LYIYKWLNSGSVAPGYDLTYGIYYDNYGTSAAANVIITDTLPTGVSFVSASGGFTPTVSGNQVIWNLSSVPGQYTPGYYGYLYLEVHLSDTVPSGSALCNRADIATSDPETGLSENTSVICSPVQPSTAPSHLTATSVSQSQVNLTWWDNSSDELGFKIERSPNGTSGWTPIYTTTANITGYSDTGLTCGTPYYYRTRAYNASGNSGYSDVANTTTFACSAPLDKFVYLPLVARQR